MLNSFQHLLEIIEDFKLSYFHGNKITTPLLGFYSYLSTFRKKEIYIQLWEFL